MSALDLHRVRRDHGGTVYDNGQRWVGPGPGHSKLDASLSVWLTGGGRAGVHSFAGDDFARCASYLGLKRSETEQLDRETSNRLRREREERDRVRQAADAAFCEGVWRSAVPIAGTPAETYLYRRGLILEHVSDLRFHLAAPRSKPDASRDPPPPLPAMIAVVRNHRGHAQALHTTALRSDGSDKAAVSKARLMFGKTGGCAVQLEPMIAAGILAVAEGIETAASFSILHGVPTWAGAVHLRFRQLRAAGLQGSLIVAGDNDDSGAGLRMATKLAERVRARCDVELRLAPSGQDWNDVLIGRCHG